MKTMKNEKMLVEINEVNFPDENFREFISDTFDTGGKGYLTKEGIAIVTFIDCSDSEIASLKGIEHFTALEMLICFRNQLTTLDVSKNPALEWLDCSYNQLTTLDVSKNPALERLNCDHNQLTTLDVSSNPALTDLWCDSNQLTELRVRECPKLEALWCKNNQLTALDVSKNPELDIIFLSCDENVFVAVADKKEY